MNKIIKNIIWYAACAGLVAFFGFVFLKGRKPEVSREYRMYYIDHTLSDYPGEGNFSYTPGTMQYCMNYSKWDKRPSPLCLTKGKGWNRSEEQGDGAWSTAAESEIYFPLNAELAAGGVLKIDTDKYEGSGEVDVLLVFTKDESLTGSAGFDTGAQVTEKIGSFSDKGEHTFTLPKLREGDITRVIFRSGDNTFRLRTIQLG